MMPEFKNREEYKEWKAKRLGNTPPLEEEKHPDSKTAQPFGGQAYENTLAYRPQKTNVKVVTTIGLLILIISILLYTTIHKGSKSNIVQEAKKTSNIVQEKKEAVGVIQTKSWPNIIRETKKAVVTVKTPNAVGSGFLISSDGLIMTNSHVIQDNTDIEVVFNSKESKTAYIIKNGNAPLDIAILKVLGDSFDFLSLADSDNCTEGDEVVAIGAPLALSETITKGIISNCNRQLKAELSDIKYVQTDAAINPGNSGGPLINNRGEVLGILTMKIAMEGTEGLNFAIASNVAKEFRDGKLMMLEETVRQLAEERLRKEQDRKKGISDSFAYTYNVLRSTWRNEYTTYYSKIVWMVERRALSGEQGQQLLQRVTIPPQGFASLNDWLASLTGRVLKGEITVDEASSLIRSSFVI
jgi:V8-like Glu-specific endopeptidase